MVLGINGLILILHTSESEASCSNIVQVFNNNGVCGGGRGQGDRRYLMNHSKMYNQQQHVYNFLSTCNNNSSLYLIHFIRKEKHVVNLLI